MKRLIILLIFISTNFLYGQSNNTIQDRFWLGLGDGITVVRGNYEFIGVGLDLTANYAFDKSKFQFKYSYLEEPNLSLFIFYYVPDKFNQYSLMYGYGKVKKGYYIIASSGISYLQQITGDKKTYFLIPLEFEIFLKATKYAGIGIVLSADISSDVQILRIGTRLGFGKVR